MTKAERIYRTLTNEAKDKAHLGCDSIRFFGEWKVVIRTIDNMTALHNTRLDRALRINTTPEKENVLRIVTNSIVNEKARLASLF